MSHKQASRWFPALSPYDTLVHGAQVNGYNAAGSPTIGLACGDAYEFGQCKLPRGRYETNGRVVTCLSCLVTMRDGECH